MCSGWLSPTKGAAEATAGERNELAAELTPEVVSELLWNGSRECAARMLRGSRVVAMLC